MLSKLQKKELESIAKEFHPWWSFAPSEMGADIYFALPHVAEEDYLEISIIGERDSGQPSLGNFAGNWWVNIHNRAVNFDVEEM